MSAPDSHGPSSYIGSLNDTHEVGGPLSPDLNASGSSNNLIQHLFSSGFEPQTASRQGQTNPAPQLGYVRCSSEQLLGSHFLTGAECPSWLSAPEYQSYDSIEQLLEGSRDLVDEDSSAGFLDNWFTERLIQQEEGEPSGSRQKRRKVAHEPSGSSLGMAESGALTDSPRPKLAVPESVTTDEYDNVKRCLLCPFRVVQEKQGLPYTCRARPATTMSAVRRHLTRDKIDGKESHLTFLRLCKACNEDFLDMSEFESAHGHNGLLCKYPKKQRKGDAGQQEQYEILCKKVESFMAMESTIQPDNMRMLNSKTHSSPLLETKPAIAQNRPAMQTIERQVPPTLHPPLTSAPQIISHNSLGSYLETTSASTYFIELQGPELEEPRETLQEEYGPDAEPYTSLVEPNTPCSTISDSMRSELPPRLSSNGSLPDDEWIRSTIPLEESWPTCRLATGLEEPWFACVSTGIPETSYLVQDLEDEGSAVVSGKPAALQFHFNRRSPTPQIDLPAHCPYGDHYLPQPLMTRTASSASSCASEASSIGMDTPDILRCDIQGCDSSFTGRYRKGNLARHTRITHRRDQPYVCQSDGCGKSFRRQDARLKHYRRHHTHLTAATPFVPRSDRVRGTGDDQDEEMRDVQPEREIATIGP